MAAAAHRAVVLASGLAVAAAFVWATYYFFVLGSGPSLAPSAFLVYPFLAGGGAFAAWSIGRGHGRSFLQLWWEPSAWLRVALMVGMQVAVLAATYAAGAVDTSLLSLVGDVVLTPVLLLAIFRENVARLRSFAFVPGLALATVGAGLTIVGGESLRPLEGWAWLVAPAVPVTVAVYFLLAARASLKVPMDAVIAQVTLASGGVAVILAPLLPGGLSGLVVTSPADAAVLIALGITSFFFAPLLYFAGIERVGLMLPALLMATIPIFTLLLSWLVLRELPPWIAILGVPVAVLGAALASRGEHRPWSPEYPLRAVVRERDADPTETR
ncbi:MAG: DMT family transporter [Thermoplasmata archaeon]